MTPFIDAQPQRFGIAAVGRSQDLPVRSGVGLKPQHFRQIVDDWPDVGFFEVHAENYMVAGGPFHHYLGRIRERYPLSLHGVGLSIGGGSPLDREHLRRMAQLIERYAPSSVSEHLAWSSHGDVYLNDLLPLPYDAATLQRVCDHVDEVQNHLKRPMLLENPATYIEFAASEMTETEFIGEVVRRAGCGLLLDINNVHVTCTNHGRDAEAYLAALPLHAVGEIHLAGFAVSHDAAGDPLLIDSHGSPVAEAVWQLYQSVLDRTGAVATLIERDHDVPEFDVLCEEAGRAGQLLRAHSFQAIAA